MAESLDSSFTLCLSQGNSLGLGPAGCMDDVIHRFHLALQVKSHQDWEVFAPIIHPDDGSDHFL